MRHQSLAILLCLSANHVAWSADDTLSFYASYDRSTTADVCQSGPAKPTFERATKLVPGIRGRAVFIGGVGSRPWVKSPVLEYDGTGHLNAEEGTVSFWVQPDWDGHYYETSRMPCYTFFSAFGGAESPDFVSKFVKPDAGRLRMRLWMWHWLRADIDVGMKDGGKRNAVSMERKCRDDFMRADWWHVALAWDRDGWARLYVNGDARPRGMGGGKRFPMRVRFHPEDVQRFYVGCVPFTAFRNYRAVAAIDELKIYRRALSDAEVEAEYRRFAPVDMLVSRRYLRAGRTEQVKLDLNLGEGVPRAQGRLSLDLASSSGVTIASQEHELVLTSRETVTMPVGILAPGEYRLSCVLRHGDTSYQRSYALVAYSPELPPQPESLDDLKLGERVVLLECAKNDDGLLEDGQSQIQRTAIGAYREAGKEKADRFAYEVKLRAPAGHPHVIQVTYPDDRERSMGLYMYPWSKHRMHREHLSGGVQCGGEYPNSNRMQTVRYLFWPMKEDYLFEARTMVVGCPAAVQKVEIYRVDGRLPKLRVSLPKEAPGRSMGLLDEDQSFEVHLRPEYFSSRQYPVRAFERLMEYMDYTGQDVLSYSLIRYTGPRYYDAARFESHKTRLLKPGWVELLLDLMAERGIQLLANVNLYSLPMVECHPDRRESMTEQGVFAIDKNGRTVGSRRRPTVNPVHPHARAELLAMVRDLVQRFGQHRALRGVDLWCMFDSCPVTWNSLDHGYGDFTVGLFESETGIKVPAGSKPATRHAFLTGPRHKEWLRWRAEKTTELLRQLAGVVGEARPDLRLYVTIGGLTREGVAGLGEADFAYDKYLYEERGIDLAALKQIPSVTVTPMREITMYRWLKHWYAGKETVVAEANFDVGKFRIFRNGPHSATSLFLRYFESFKNSLKPDKFAAYFQNADVKAAGRYFLQDYALAMAAQDPAQILCGAQPLGVTGRDAEAREFAQAFRALPIGAYTDIPGLRDPVCGRAQSLGPKTYFYVCNLIWTDVDVDLDLPVSIESVVDLSSAERVSVTNGKLSIRLRPFQLRSFVIERGGVTISSGVAKTPASTMGWYKGRLSSVEADVTKMAELGADTSAYQARMDAIKGLLSRGTLAEAHRQLHSKVFREIPGELLKAEKGYLKEMAGCLARSKYRVDCGSAKFYRSNAGKLFFPDQSYTKGGWGYDGGYKSVDRGGRNRGNTDDDDLFRTEAYLLDAYRFTVKPGQYTVRLHLAVGYQPSARPGVFVFDVYVEGKPALRDFDVFVEAGNRAHAATTPEINGIEVKDGVLDIEFRECPKTADPTAKLCNAIEILPEM